MLAQTGFDAVGLDIFPIGLGGGGKAVWHADVLRLQMADHLAQGGILAADASHIAHAQFLEPLHICCHGVLLPNFGLAVL